MKILVWADSPVVSTGFGIVSKNILSGLHKLGHEIHVLGINGYGEPYNHEQYPYQIWPCDRGGPMEVYGYRKLWYLVDQIKPDILFMINDPWIIHTAMEMKPKETSPFMKIVGYYPTDGAPIKPIWMKSLNELDAQICYSYYAQKVVMESNKGKIPNNLSQIYHGVNTKSFFPINQQLARRELGIPLDLFIVGMIARNQPRKRFDVMMAGFAKFAKDKENVKLYLHTPLEDVGFDIANLADQLEITGKLILTEGLTPVEGVSEQRLNLIHNSFDVNCLFSLGDGFGLPVAESMATGCPQLVSDHSCLRELVDGHGGLTARTAAWLMNPGGINTWGGLTDYKDVATKLQVLYDKPEYRIKLAQEGYDFITQDKFTWEYAVTQFNEIFSKLFHLITV